MVAAQMCGSHSLAFAALLCLSWTGTAAGIDTNSTPVAQGFLVAWPPLAGTCNSATFASYPLGAQAQPSAAAQSPAAELSWSLGPETSDAALAPLRSALELASSSRRQTLVLGPSELKAVYDAVKASPDRFRHGASVMLEVRLTTQDAEGALTAASAAVELRDSEPPPSIAAAGEGASVRAREDERITLEVRTGEVAPPCSGSPRRVAILWEYTREDMDGWVELSAARPALADEARQLNKVSFAPLTFQPHTRHMFRASAIFEGSFQVRWPRPSVVFRVAVAERAPPQARVQGPSHPYLQCDFTLDASSSTDPLGPPGSSLAYRWACRPLDPRVDALVEACSRLENFSPEKVWRADGHGGSGPTLHVAGGRLLPGAYLFTVEVRRRYGAGHSGPRPDTADTAQLLVTVVGGARPPVAVELPWAHAGRISVEAASAPTVRAVVEGSAPYGCLVNAGWEWAFALQTAGGQVRFLALLATSTNFSAIGAPTEVTTNEFRRDLLVPGQAYSYSLLWAPRWIELERLRQRQSNGVFLPSDVAEVKMMVAATSAPFVADGPPTSGTVFASPPSGEAVKTLFTLETGMWSDELPGQLEYAFYRLPTQQARDANGQVEVEWEDASSPRYWARLGGRLLQPWSPQRTAPGILLPPGVHLLAARARDALGATGTIFSNGPALTAASAFSVLDAEAALNAAAATSSFDRLLAAIDAVSEASSAAGGGASGAAEREALAAALLHALEASAALAGGGAGSADAERLPQVLGAAVRSGSAGAGTAAMTRASSVLESCLDLLSWRGASGVPKGAGDAVLGALAAIDGGLGAPAAAQAASARDAGAAAADRLLTFAQRLSRSALMGLSTGESLTLRGEGAGGAPGAELSIGLVLPGTGGNSSNASGVDPHAGNANNDANIRALGLHLPLAALSRSSSSSVGAQRLLAAAGGAGSCGPVGVQRMEWFGGNPHRWAAPAAGHNGLVPDGAAVTTLYFWHCGEAAPLQASPQAPLRLEMRLPAVTASASRTPACLLFDTSAQAWVSDGLHVEEDPADSSRVFCVVGRAAVGTAGASFVVLPEGLPPPPTQAPAAPPPESDLTLLFVGVGCGVALFLIAICVGSYCWRRSRRKLNKVSAAKLSDAADEDWKLEQFSKDSPDSKALVRSQGSTPSLVVASTDQRQEALSRLRSAATPEAPDLPLVLAMLDQHPRAQRPRARQEINREYAERMMAQVNNYTTPPRSRGPQLD